MHLTVLCTQFPVHSGLGTPDLPLGGLEDVSHSKPKLSDRCQGLGLSHRSFILMMVVGDRDSSPCVIVEEAIDDPKMLNVPRVT